MGGKHIAWVAALAICAQLAGAAPGHAQADDFPNHPVRIIVGPSPDVFARIIAEHLTEAWKQPVVVEHRPGAGGKIAVTAVAGAQPDGHTLLFATPTYTLATAMGVANFDFLKELAPAALMGQISYALVVHPSVPAKSVAELVALAKQKPGQLNCASAGYGTVPHLACETFNNLAGVNVLHVPFKDVNSAMMGVAGDHVQMFVAVSTVAKAQIAAGTVRKMDALDDDHDSTPAQHLVGDHPEVAAFLVARGARSDLLLAAALGDIAQVRRHLDADPAAIAMRVDQDWFPMIDTAANGGHIYQWTLGFHVSAFDVARKRGHAEVLDLLLTRAGLLDRMLDALWCGDEARANTILAADPQLVATAPSRALRQVADAARTTTLRRSRRCCAAVSR